MRKNEERKKGSTNVPQSGRPGHNVDLVILLCIISVVIFSLATETLAVLCLDGCVLSSWHDFAAVAALQAPIHA